MFFFLSSAAGSHSAPLAETKTFRTFIGKRERELRKQAAIESLKQASKDMEKWDREVSDAQKQSGPAEVETVAQHKRNLYRSDSTLFNAGDSRKAFSPRSDGGQEPTFVAQGLTPMPNSAHSFLDMFDIYLCVLVIFR